MSKSKKKAPESPVRRISVAAFVALFILSMVSNLLMLTGPLFMLQVYDRVLASRSVPTLIALVVLITALFGFYGIIEALRSRMALRFANLFDQRMSERLFTTAVRLRLVSGPASNLDPVRDGDAIRAFLSGPGPISLLDLPWVPLYLIVVFAFHPLLGWLATGGGLIITLMMIASEYVLRRSSSEGTAAAALRQRRTDDARNNADAIIAMGMMEDVRRRWGDQNRKMLAIQRSGGDRSTAFSSVTKAIRFLLQSLVLGLGAYLVIKGEMTGGLMIAASVVTSRALAPIEQVIGQWRGFVTARQAWQRIKRYLATEPAAGATRLPLPKETLSVRQLATGPQGAQKPVVSGIQFDLVAGDGLGILGPSGSGKSSLARSLLGVWPLMGGELRLDGAMLAHYDPSQMGRIAGYLPQRVDLMEGTVAENISRFQPGASSEDIIEAARRANVHDLINSLPEGYETQVGNQGDRLSAGQRQRIGLARALFGNPFLLVLDEPNSNLDAEGEGALTDAIARVRADGGIAIVVAHRPSAVTSLNKLLVLKAGRQVTFGPKQEVLQQVMRGDNVHPIKAPAQ